MTGTRLLCGFAVLTVMAGTSCGDARSAEGRAGKEARRGRVENNAPHWRDGEGWAVSATPLVAIGGNESDSTSALPGVAGVVRLQDGRIVVADRGAIGIRVYDPSGRHLLTSGGKGEPGT